MAHTITNRCTKCGECFSRCPIGAVQFDTEVWIDPTVCNDCRGHSAEPQCVIACPIIDAPPMPLQAKKGRCRTTDRAATSFDLFPDGKSNFFASAMVVWEACNLFAQRQSLSWNIDEKNRLYYERSVNDGRGKLLFRIAHTVDRATAESTIAAWDIRAACLHLIYAAHAATLSQPWEEEFTISDQQIEAYLGLDKRRDLSKLAKLTLIKKLAQQPCELEVDVKWYQQGRVKSFSIEADALWQMVEIEHHFQTDELGCKHLTGLTFTLKAGAWSQYFLNRQGAKAGTAFYQYGSLPRSLLSTVTSIWQQHEGAVRMMLWLLFKLKMGTEQRITVPTLIRIAYGETKLMQATVQREDRKRLVRSFESDLEVLNHYGLKPQFDPLTYASEIQPLWVKLASLPDDAEAAIEFWIDDANRTNRLTDAAPRNKWPRLMQARLTFELPPDWATRSTSSKSPRKRRKPNHLQEKTGRSLSGEEIAIARKQQQLSQRALASRIGKSQSWIRDVESGRLQVSQKDQHLLLNALHLAGE